MESPQQKLDRYEYVIRLQMAEIDKLRTQLKGLVDWIMGDSDALTCLQAVYSNPTSSEGNRIKAAAAVPFERPKLSMSYSVTTDHREPIPDHLRTGGAFQSTSVAPKILKPRRR